MLKSSVPTTACRLTSNAERRKVFRVVETKKRPNRLREIRELRDLTQEALAELARAAGNSTSSQQQVDKHEKTSGTMKDQHLRAYAAALQCSEQDILGPPRFPSVFGYTRSPGELGPPIDEPLMTRILAYIDSAREQARLAPEKKAALAAVIYASALRDAAEAGVPPTQLDLSRYAGLIRLAA